MTKKKKKKKKIDSHPYDPYVVQGNLVNSTNLNAESN